MRRLLNRQRGRRDERSFQKLLLTVHAVEHRRKLRPTVPVTHIDNADRSNLVAAVPDGPWTSRGFSPPAPKTMQRDFGRTV